MPTQGLDERTATRVMAFAKPRRQDRDFDH